MVLMGALTGRSASFLAIFPSFPTPLCTFKCCTASFTSHWIWRRTHTISRLVQVQTRDRQPSRDLGGAAYHGISTESRSLGRKDEVSGRDTSANAKML